MTRAIETHSIIWRGIVIEIRYEACWRGSDGPFSTAHLQVESLVPERTALPITETGYRSHFLPASAVVEAGGPVAYVTAWLDHKAGSKDWKDRQDAARQMSLF